MHSSRNTRLIFTLSTAVTLVITPLHSAWAGVKAAKKKSTAVTAGGSVVGPTVDTRWGPVQVTISLANHKLADIQASIYPNHKRRSVQINSRALPILHDEVISTQSAKIDNVSGATITTEGYTGSLQQAIDTAVQKGLL